VSGGEGRWKGRSGELGELEEEEAKAAQGRTSLVNDGLLTQLLEGSGDLGAQLCENHGAGAREKKTEGNQGLFPAAVTW
jgi:hypothetical protein